MVPLGTKLEDLGARSGDSQEVPPIRGNAHTPRMRVAVGLALCVCVCVVSATGSDHPPVDSHSHWGRKRDLDGSLGAVLAHPCRVYQKRILDTSEQTHIFKRHFGQKGWGGGTGVITKTPG